MTQKIISVRRQYKDQVWYETEVTMGSTHEISKNKESNSRVHRPLFIEVPDEVREHLHEVGVRTD